MDVQMILSIISAIGGLSGLFSCAYFSYKYRSINQQQTGIEIKETINPHIIQEQSPNEERKSDNSHNKSDNSQTRTLKISMGQYESHETHMSKKFPANKDGLAAQAKSIFSSISQKLNKQKKEGDKEDKNTGDIEQMFVKAYIEEQQKFQLEKQKMNNRHHKDIIEHAFDVFVNSPRADKSEGNLNNKNQKLEIRQLTTYSDSNIPKIVKIEEFSPLNSKRKIDLKLEIDPTQKDEKSLPKSPFSLESKIKQAQLHSDDNKKPSDGTVSFSNDQCKKFFPDSDPGSSAQLSKPLSREKLQSQEVKGLEAKLKQNDHNDLFKQSDFSTPKLCPKKFSIQYEIQIQNDEMQIKSDEIPDDPASIKQIPQHQKPVKQNITNNIEIKLVNITGDNQINDVQDMY